MVALHVKAISGRACEAISGIDAHEQRDLGRAQSDGRPLHPVGPAQFWRCNFGQWRLCCSFTWGVIR